jgi:acyl carrier protein
MSARRLERSRILARALRTLVQGLNRNQFRPFTGPHNAPSDPAQMLQFHHRNAIKGLYPALVRKYPLMDQSLIYPRLTEIFEDVFDDDSIEVTPQLTAKDVDGWDSLNHIRLILTIEKAFKIKFSTSEIGSLENVGGLVALIQARA